LRDFRFFFVAQGDDSQHQIDQVERTEEHHHREKYDTHRATRCQHLKQPVNTHLNRWSVDAMAKQIPFQKSFYGRGILYYKSVA
jgi:hypothetical protein